MASLPHFPSLRFFSIQKFEMQILQPEHIKEYLDAAKARGLLPMFYLELVSGLRKGELTALLWSDLDIQNRTISVSKQYVKNPNGELTLTRPKTETSARKVSIPQEAVDLLISEHDKHPDNPYMFPSPITGEMYYPDSIVNLHKKILKDAGLPHIRFHDLRHTFATMSLEHGMDVKTLSAIIGHVSAKTTLNIYTHITSEMQENAAVSIDRGIAKAEVSEQKTETASEVQTFEPYTPPRRRPGTGYIKQLKETLWEGRYSPVWPDGKKHSRNVYGHTKEECEEKLAKLILQMKAEITALRNGTAAEYPDGVNPKKKQLAEYLRQHPGVSNKSYIARETGMDRTTVQKYYDEVRAEMATLVAQQNQV